MAFSDFGTHPVGGRGSSGEAGSSGTQGGGGQLLCAHLEAYMLCKDLSKIIHACILDCLSGVRGGRGLLLL